MNSTDRLTNQAAANVYRISAALRHGLFSFAIFRAFYGLGKATMDAMDFIFNRYPISQAGRRGFDPRLPLVEISWFVY